MLCKGLVLRPQWPSTAIPQTGFKGLPQAISCGQYRHNNPPGKPPCGGFEPWLGIFLKRPHVRDFRGSAEGVLRGAGACSAAGEILWLLGEGLVDIQPLESEAT